MVGIDWSQLETTIKNGTWIANSFSPANADIVSVEFVQLSYFLIAFCVSILCHSFYLHRWKRTTVRIVTDVACVALLCQIGLLLDCSTGQCGQYQSVIEVSLLANGVFSVIVQGADNYMTYLRYEVVVGNRVSKLQKGLTLAYVIVNLYFCWWPFFTLAPLIANMNTPTALMYYQNFQYYWNFPTYTLYNLFHTVLLIIEIRRLSAAIKPRSNNDHTVVPGNDPRTLGEPSESKSTTFSEMLLKNMRFMIPSATRRGAVVPIGGSKPPPTTVTSKQREKKQRNREDDDETVSLTEDRPKALKRMAYKSIMHDMLSICGVGCYSFAFPLGSALQDVLIVLGLHFVFNWYNAREDVTEWLEIAWDEILSWWEYLIRPCQPSTCACLCCGVMCIKVADGTDLASVIAAATSGADPRTQEPQRPSSQEQKKPGEIGYQRVSSLTDSRIPSAFSGVGGRDNDRNEELERRFLRYNHYLGMKSREGEPRLGLSVSMNTPASDPMWRPKKGSRSWKSMEEKGDGNGMGERRKSSLHFGLESVMEEENEDHDHDNDEEDEWAPGDVESGSGNIRQATAASRDQDEVGTVRTAPPWIPPQWRAPTSQTRATPAGNSSKGRSRSSKGPSRSSKDLEIPDPGVQTVPTPSFTRPRSLTPPKTAEHVVSLDMPARGVNALPSHIDNVNSEELLMQSGSVRRQSV